MSKLISITTNSKDINEKYFTILSFGKNTRRIIVNGPPYAACQNDWPSHTVDSVCGNMIDPTNVIKEVKKPMSNTSLVGLARTCETVPSRTSKSGNSTIALVSIPMNADKPNSAAALGFRERRASQLWDE